MKLRTAILTLALLLSSAPAYSQACAMCSSNASGTAKDGQRAIGKGVVVLLVPSLGFMTLGIWTAFRYCKMRDLEEANLSSLRSAAP